MTITYDALIARWNTDKGKPFKGSLIDVDAYKKDPTDPGCMCAQGQTLHDLGGWTAEQLGETPQDTADEATAKLLNISVAHAILLRQINDSADGAPAIVLTDPGKALGDQWSKLLDFWSYLDGASLAAREAAWVAARVAAWEAAGEAARVAAGVAAGVAAREAAWVAAWVAAGEAAGEAARVAAGVAAGVAAEIQGAEILRRDGKPFFFLPLFGFASPDDIPARPADYGVPIIGKGETK